VPFRDDPIPLVAFEPAGVAEDVDLSALRSTVATAAIPTHYLTREATAQFFAAVAEPRPPPGR
jgi:hypothetical protein